MAWWSLRPRLDWLLGLVAILVWRTLRGFDLVGPLDLVDPAARRAVYSQAGALGGAVIGLFVVPVSVVLAFAPRERLQRVLARRQGELRRAVMQAGTAAALLVVFSIVAVALDATSTGNRGVRLVAPGVFSVAGLSLVRVLRVLGALLALSERDARPSMADTIRPISPDEDLERSA